MALLIKRHGAPALRAHGFFDRDRAERRGRLVLPALAKASRPDSERRGRAGLGLDPEQIVFQDRDPDGTRAVGSLRSRIGHAFMMP